MDYRRTFAGRRQRWFGLKPLIKRSLAAPVVHPVLRTTARTLPGVRNGRLPAPAGLSEVVGVVGGGRFVLTDPARCEIAKELYWGKGRRPDESDAFALDIVVALAKTAEVFVDVGAYTGVFTIATLAANPALRAHAFEMVPAVVTGLQKNIARNDMGARAVVHPTGVGASGARMRVPTGDGGSALPSFYSARMEFAEGIEVAFTSLDDLLEDVPAEARVVMKVDVEGAENTVLAHGQQFLARHRPDILCEVLRGQADGAELESLLAPHGYRWYLVRERDLLARRRIVPDATYRDWLLTARPPAEIEEDLGRVLA